MESPTYLPESPMEQEDIPFPCKGCGEVCMKRPLEKLKKKNYQEIGMVLT